MSVKEIEPIDETGFPRALKKLVNQIADRVNRKIKVKFATDSVNAQASVVESEDDIVITLPRGLGAASTRNPFEVLTCVKTGGGFQRGVYFGSTLFKSLDYTDTATITGLLTSLTPGPSDTGWKDVIATDLVWLEIAFSSWPSAFTASIKSLGAGDTYDGGELESDDGTGSPVIYTQTKARLPLASLSVSGGVLTKTQFVNWHRVMMLTSGDAKKSDATFIGVIPCSYPMPK